MATHIDEFNQRLLDFLGAAVTPFHATQLMAERLSNAGFQSLAESESWDLKPNTGYWATRNDSSIIAFRTGNDQMFSAGIRMVGAHTDSPCLKVKPQPEITSRGCLRLAAEVYGGALLAPWFDRGLSLAGRVSYKSTDGLIGSTLVNIKKAIAHIPSLAIHLDATANKERKINAQKELNMVLALSASSTAKTDKANNWCFGEFLSDQVQSELGLDTAVDVLDYEIYAYDTQLPEIMGLNDEFIASARLDNLLSCFVGIEALLAAENDTEAQLLICTDHEEVGSQSACGAQGPFLRDVLERICQNSQHLSQVLARSMMISADNAHALHPNFPEKHDGNHGPQINKGPVIKVNANQRYATNSETAALFKLFAEQANVGVQSFVSRNDMGCGSTIGPIAASEVGVATIDVGCPQWGMHSIRETAGTQDAHALCNILQHFYNYDKPLAI